MSHHVSQPHVDQQPPRAPTAQQRPEGASDTQRPQAALTAGVSLLVLAVLSGSATFAVIQPLVPDGASGVVVASDFTLRAAVASLYVVVALDVLAAWALMRVFRPVHAGVSQLAGWFRLAYSAVYLAAIAQLAGISELLNAEGTSAFTPDQVEALAGAKVAAFNDIWMAGLLLFGVHLALLGYLTYRSAQVPSLIGVLLVVAGLGYVYDTLITVLSTGTPFLISTFTFLGEFLLALWLVIRGRRLTPDDTHRVQPLPLSARP